MAMLNWENEALAKAAGIAPTSVFNIKRGLTRPQPRILSAIRNALESNGIEFLDNSGVRFRPEGMDVLSGRAGMIRFFDMVYNYVRETPQGLIRQNYIQEKLFPKYLGDYADVHRKRMGDLAARNIQHHARVILPDGDFDFMCTDYAAYRWFPKNIPPPVPYYIFGDNLAIFAFQADPPPKIVVIQSASIADSYRVQFDQIWAISKEPPAKRGG